jgi:class 3 adenylate cyclase
MPSGPIPSDAEFEAAGLYDPVEHRSTGRLELLRWLSEHGFDLDAMVVGLRTDAIASMAGDRRLVPGERLRRSEAMVVAGVDGDVFDDLVRALGFRAIQGSPPGEVGVTMEEARAVGFLAALRTVFSPEEALSLLRTVGASVGRMADAAVSLFLTDVESPLVLGGHSELELAHRGYEAVGVLDGFGTALDPVMRRLVLQAIEETRRTTVDYTERFQYRYAIGFIDLVGFTEVSAGMVPADLGDFIRVFEGRAHDMAAAAGARVVKLIGDEVMFVADDAAAACRAGKALMDGFASTSGTVLPRGGLAYGKVLPRGGDYYGTVVNLAARLVDEAVPQELLATEALADAAVGCEFEPAGRRMVKGFAEPVTVRSLVSVS